MENEINKGIPDMEQVERAISKGERTRVLFDILMSELGVEIEEGPSNIWKELMKVQDEYYEAIKLMALIVKERHRGEQGVS